MATIINPTPITPQTFGSFWIVQLQLLTKAGKTMLQASLAPCDGTHLLATSTKRVFVADIDAEAATDAATAAALADLRAEVQRLAAAAGIEAAAEILQVNAPDPTKPVNAQVLFAQPAGQPNVPPLRIPDCFAKAAADAQFAAVFQETLALVARLAGLSVS